jgi:hypothetical protein
MKYPFVIIKKVDNEWWYHGADKDLDSASKVLFYLGQTSSSAVTDGRIVEVKDQYQLDQLRKTVNNVPASL